MKALVLSLLVALATTLSVNSQDLTNKKSYVNKYLEANYQVLKSDNKTIEGVYTITNVMNGKAIAIGKYYNNKPIGNWYFYNFEGELEQKYNYDSKDAPINLLLNNKVTYDFGIKIDSSDIIKVPVKIGGISYGLDFLYLNPNRSVTNEFINISVKEAIVTDHLKIDKNGKLYAWETSFKSKRGEKRFLNSIKNLEEYNLNFIPAYLNGEPILSEFSITRQIEYSGGSRIVPYRL